MAEDSANNKNKVRYCARCQNHGVSEQLKGHKRHCPYRNCKCENCQFTQLRQSIMVKVGHIGRRRTEELVTSSKAKRQKEDDDDKNTTASSSSTSSSTSASASASLSALSASAINGDLPSTHQNGSEDNQVEDVSSPSSSQVPGCRLRVGGESKDVTSVPGPIRCHGDTQAPSPVLSENHGSRGGAFASFSSSTVPRVSSNQKTDGLSTISSIILGFCGNDAKKAVKCIEKAYKELLALANPELKAPSSELHFAGHSPGGSACLSLAAPSVSSHLPLGIRSLVGMNGPDPGLMWTPPGGSTLPGSSMASLLADGTGSSVFFHGLPRPSASLFSGENQFNSRLLKNPFIGSSSLL